MHRNIDYNLQKKISDNPGKSKQFSVEELIRENPYHKNKIINYISAGIKLTKSSWRELYTPDTVKKLEKRFSKMDLQERNALSEKRSEDQIKVLKAVNKTHNDFLDEIKSHNNLLQGIKNSKNKNIVHYNNTMDLFE